MKKTAILVFTLFFGTTASVCAQGQVDAVPVAVPSPAAPAVPETVANSAPTQIAMAEPSPTPAKAAAEPAAQAKPAAPKPKAKKSGWKRALPWVIIGAAAAAAIWWSVDSGE